MPKALGLIETRGLVAAIEAADAMVKTSNVTLIGKEITRPALVTIKIVGEVAAVKAAVDAGAAAARKVGTVVSTHVIPQPDSQMELILPEIKDDEGKKERPAKSEAAPPPVSILRDESQPEKNIPPVSGIPLKKPKAEITEPPEDESHFTGITNHLERLRAEALGKKQEKIKEETKQKETLPVTKSSMAELEMLNVHELRKRAIAAEGFPIQGREISKANRRQLLDFFKKMI